MFGHASYKYIFYWVSANPFCCLKPGHFHSCDFENEFYKIIDIYKKDVGNKGKERGIKNVSEQIRTKMEYNKASLLRHEILYIGKTQKVS